MNSCNDLENQTRITCSVAMATYNGEKYIYDQLESIINQTVLPEEVVISDDHSSDSTLKIIMEFIKEHSDTEISFKIFSNEIDNKGVTGNFANAFKNTTGDIVFVCDQDDIWHSKKIEIIKKYFVEYQEMELLVHNAQIIKQIETGYCVENTYFFENHSKIVGDAIFGKPFVKLQKEQFINAVLRGNFINGMCMTARRSFLLSIFPFPKLNIYDAWIMFCSIANDTCYAINQSLAYYRIHSNNTIGLGYITSKKKKDVLKKLKNYLNVSESSIIGRYFWSDRVLCYMGESFFSVDESIKYLYSYNHKERLSIIESGKIMAVYKLICSYNQKIYENIGCLFHDVFYVIAHTKKYRKNMIENQIRYIYNNDIESNLDSSQH